MEVGGPVRVGARRHERDVRPRERLERAPDALERRVAGEVEEPGVERGVGDGHLVAVARRGGPLHRLAERLEVGEVGVRHPGDAEAGAERLELEADGVGLEQLADRGPPDAGAAEREDLDEAERLEAAERLADRAPGSPRARGPGSSRRSGPPGDSARQGCPGAGGPSPGRPGRCARSVPAALSRRLLRARQAGLGDRRVLSMVVAGGLFASRAARRRSREKGVLRRMAGGPPRPVSDGLWPATTRTCWAGSRGRTSPRSRSARGARAPSRHRGARARRSSRPP